MKNINDPVQQQSAAILVFLLYMYIGLAVRSALELKDRYVQHFMIYEVLNCIKS